MTKHSQSSYNAKSKKATFSHNVHHGEVRPGTVVHNDAPSAFQQSLSAKKGVSGAAQSLIDRYKQSH